MPRDLLVELGCEEVPARSVDLGIEQLRIGAGRVLAELRLPHEAVEATGTPRRLVLYVRDVADSQEGLAARRRGPAAKAAFDESGRPTKAAEGFARGQGVAVEDLFVEADDQGEYVWAVKEEAGRPATEVLPEGLTRLVQGLSFPKEMRWGDGAMRFVRPLRWLLALFGADVVPLALDGLSSGRITWGHRFLAPGPFEVADAGAYHATLADSGGVLLDRDARARAIADELSLAAAERGWRPVLDDPPFTEVVNLVEAPHVVVGSFKEEHAGLPREVLTTAMESHQRYFPVEDAEGRLAPGFLVVHNGDVARADAIRRGHERVIQARLADAGFFFAEDRKVPLADRVEQLGELVFQEKLGTVRDKARRVSRLAGELAGVVGAPGEAADAAERAGLLAKADLVTGMVVEFPSLQGVMGREYARLDGERDDVADAIFEHYLPRSTGDDLPSSLVGSLVSIADKADTIVGCFAAGLIPSGSEDPYALRRQGLGIVRIADERPMSFDLAWLVDEALAGYGDDVARASGTSSTVMAFLVDRVRSHLDARGMAYDRIDAVLAQGVEDVASAVRRVRSITDFMATPGADDLLVGFTRAANLSQADLGTDTDESVMGDAERRLVEALVTAERESDAALAAGDYAAALGTLAALRGPVDLFFTDVLVMDEDATLRENRLRLLNRLVAVFQRLADFSRIVVAGPGEGR